MRVVVVGATGNVGTSVVSASALAADPKVEAAVGLARRLPDWSPPKTTFVEADVSEADLTPLSDGADAVVHLALLFQPTHRPAVTWESNVVGSVRVFTAAAAAKVGALVHASSVGAYSARPADDHAVDESWPVPAAPELLDMAMTVPLLATGRAERELGWRPTRSAVEAVAEAAEGIADGAGMATDPLTPRRLVS